MKYIVDCKVENKVSKKEKDCCSEQKLKRQRKTGNKIIPIEKQLYLIQKADCKYAPIGYFTIGWVFI